jgi:hypothetical protein
VKNSQATDSYCAARLFGRLREVMGYQKPKKKATLKLILRYTAPSTPWLPLRYLHFIPLFYEKIFSLTAGLATWGNCLGL